MAKGRRLTTSRSELYLGSNYQFNHHPSQQQTVNGSPSSELAEDEVWSTIYDDTVKRDNAQYYFSQQQQEAGEWKPRTSYGSSNGTTSFADPYATRRRPPRRSDSAASHRQVGGLSLAFDDGSEDGTVSPGIVHQFRPQDHTSSDVANSNSPRGRHMATSAPVNVPDWSKIYRVDSVESLHDVPDADGFDHGNSEAEIVPPHEYLARSRRAAANSVFEGVGRTLKGRDLRRVRDAVWSQTGFYG